MGIIRSNGSVTEGTSRVRGDNKAYGNTWERIFGNKDNQEKPVTERKLSKSFESRPSLPSEKKQEKPDSTTNNIVFTHHWHDKGFDFYNPITKEQLNKIGDILGLGSNLHEDLTVNHPIMIKMISDEQSRESSINGCMYDGYTRENAERIVDGIEPIDEDE